MNTHFRERDNYVRITELTPDLKRKIEDAVENLLLILDAYAGDENAEDDGSDEPINGWPSQGQSVTNAMSCDEDTEQDNADQTSSQTPSKLKSLIPFQHRCLHLLASFSKPICFKRQPKIKIMRYSGRSASGKMVNFMV